MDKRNNPCVNCVCLFVRARELTNLESLLTPDYNPDKCQLHIETRFKSFTTLKKSKSENMESVWC